MTKEEAATGSIVENLTLFHNELMSKVFDRNIPATEYLLRTIPGRKDIRVKSVKGEYNMRSPVMGGRDITLEAIFVFVVDKRTFVRYNQDIEQLFPWRPRICQN